MMILELLLYIFILSLVDCYKMAAINQKNICITLLTPSFGNCLFCLSPCSETATDKYDLVILLHSKSLKKRCKNFENQFTDKKFTPKNNLDLGFIFAGSGNHYFHGKNSYF